MSQGVYTYYVSYTDGSITRFGEVVNGEIYRRDKSEWEELPDNNDWLRGIYLGEVIWYARKITEEQVNKIIKRADLRKKSAFS